MTVVCEPHKAPYIAEIEHTLEAEQKAVGGLIEPIYLGDVCLVGNEEAKLIGMEVVTAGSEMVLLSSPVLFYLWFNRR